MKKYFLLFLITHQLYSQNSPLQYYSQEIAPTEIAWIYDDLSGVTINKNSNSIYMIENDEGTIWQLDTNINHMQTILGGQFGDEEDIVYLNNTDYAIVTEEGDLYIGNLEIGDNDIDTGEMFVGCMIGDYTKTGISTMLNTGTYIGLGANVFGEGFQDKFIPSFSWGKNDKMELEKFLSTLEIVKDRRGLKASHNEINLITDLYNSNKFKKF